MCLSRDTRPRGSPRRRGAAAAELAICLPLIVFLLLASLEACSMIYLDHGLSVASYEGVRVAINYDGTTAATRARCNEIINNRGITAATVAIVPSDVAMVERGERIKVTVSAPCDENAIVPPWFYGGKTMTSSTTMVKE
jgi:Flp pilus assembly protein TadG